MTESTILFNTSAWNSAYDSWGCLINNVFACSGWVMTNAWTRRQLELEADRYKGTFICANTSISWLGGIPARVWLMLSSDDDPFGI